MMSTAINRVMERIILVENVCQEKDGWINLRNKNQV
jgi:hypothetical protein